jgi:hypothetical protein
MPIILTAIAITSLFVGGSTLITTAALAADDFIKYQVTSRNRAYITIGQRLRRYFFENQVTDLDEVVAQEYLDQADEGGDMLSEVYLIRPQSPEPVVVAPEEVTRIVITRRGFDESHVHNEVVLWEPAEVEELSSDSPDIYAPFKQRVLSRPNRAKLVVTMSTLARIEFSLQRRTEANRLCCREFIKKQMVLHGVRPAHIAQTLDKAVALAFCPTRDQIEAITFESTAAVAERYRQVEEPRYKRGVASLLNWFALSNSRRGYSPA